MKHSSFILLSILLAGCHLCLCSKLGYISVCSENDSIWSYSTAEPEKPNPALKTIKKLNVCPDSIEAMNVLTPMKMDLENETKKYLTLVLELKDYKYIHYLASRNCESEDSQMVVIAPPGFVINSHELHQAFIPISSVNICEIIYAQNENRVALIIPARSIQSFFSQICDSYLIPINSNFEDLGNTTWNPEMKQIKIILKKDIFYLEDASLKRIDPAIRTSGLASNSNINYKSFLRNKVSYGHPRTIYKVGSEMAIDSAKLTKQCGKKCINCPSTLLHEITSPSIVFPFYKEITQDLFANNKKISSIIREEFVKNVANKQYIDTARDSDSYVFQEKESYAKPLYKSPDVYISKKNISNSGYNLSAEILIPIKFLSKDFVLKVDSLHSKSFEFGFISSLLPKDVVSKFYNTNLLRSLLSIVDHLITSMRLHQNNWHAQQTLLGLMQVIRPGILYAVNHNEEIAPLASSLYYYIVNIIYIQRSLPLIDPNMIFSMLKTMNAFSPLTSIENKAKLEKYIIYSPAFNHVFKRVILGCICVSDYSQSQSLGRLWEKESNNEIFCQCWCTQPLVEAYCDSAICSYSTPDGTESEEEKKRKLAEKSKKAAPKKITNKPKNDSGFSPSTKGIFSIVAIVLTVLAVVSVVSYYTFFR